MAIKPIKDNILFDVIKEEDVTKGGIVLPKKIKDQSPNKAIVKAIGPGRVNRKGLRIPVSVEVGDEVLIPKYAGHLVEEDDKEYLLGSEKDILAIYQ